MCCLTSLKGEAALTVLSQFEFPHKRAVESTLIHEVLQNASLQITLHYSMGIHQRELPFPNYWQAASHLCGRDEEPSAAQDELFQNSADSTRLTNEIKF